jgi:type I restriction enzyme S subunit
MDAVGVLGDIRFDQVIEQSDASTGLSYFEEDDVIVAKITPCFENGKCALAANVPGGRALGSTEFHVIRPSSAVFPRFLFYVCVSNAFREPGEAQMYGAAGQKRVPTDFVRDFCLALPEKPEQRGIAAFLDRETLQIDSLLKKKQRLIELLDEKHAALISRAVTQGLDPSVPMKDSGVRWLGPVPARWRVTRLKFTLANIEQGWSPQCDSRPAELEEWGVLKVGCVNGGTFEQSENKSLPPDLEADDRLEIRPGDVLISRANTRELVGSAALVVSVRPKLLLCDKLYRARAGKAIAPQFVALLLQCGHVRYQIEREATGASGSMQNVGQDTIRNIRCAIPEVQEQLEIARWASQQSDTFKRATSELQESIGLLREYRSTLITAAVTGQLDIRKHEKKMEALV